VSNENWIEETTKWLAAELHDLLEEEKARAEEYVRFKSIRGSKMHKVIFHVPGMKGTVEATFIEEEEARIFHTFLKKNGVAAELYITTVTKEE
jgi:hypothetical protein